ncbi:hypothetical protein D7Y41_02780 [Anaerotruncus sp. 1XD22-93]|nr:hypothetical protein [Lachnospiraceae bacterium]NBI74212.1 hypothetical protein [Lachnospiraceae bacterium]RKK00399.1 hypothetical protein D7Y41_02780 [Anaerotruncus sp. 1XD22-93]
MADTYVTMLSRIVLSMESAYGLHNANANGEKIKDLPIKSVLDYVKQSIESSTQDDINRKNQDVAKDIILLSYLARRIKYYGYYKLNYKKYPAVKNIARVLLNFTSVKRNTADCRKQLNTIIKILDELDKKQVAVRVGLAYMFLRIFIVMVLHGNLCNASIVADFIINQFSVRRN